MIFLGIGSNLSSTHGNRFQNLELAISELKKHKIKVINQSSFYETLSYPDVKKPKFINIVIEVETNLDPPELASIIFFVEKFIERKRHKKNDPRTCDIDIIDFNNKIFDFKYKNLNFFLPHKQAAYRNFVLYPLREISPNWKHPITKEIVTDLIFKLKDDEKKSILKIDKY
tara:strand:- start:2664 stop:3176 length:513 start_codon:yes stop_codon:yes gene_type:complete